MPDDRQSSRLSRNFHRTFKPERQYIASMLRFAASGAEGDIQAISEATGIPTGKSSGKVDPTLDYCRGMGLVTVDSSKKGATRRPQLTMFGRAVLLDDPFLKLGISQWIAHFNLCSPVTGADVWYQTFCSGGHSLGMTFSRRQLESHLSVVYGVQPRNLIGPLIGMYEDEAAFRVCGALAETDGVVQRKIAPVSEGYSRAYGAWLLQTMQDHFPGREQVSLSDLDAMTGCCRIPGWEPKTFIQVLCSIQNKGLLAVDRHMDPWLLRPTADTQAVWKGIYNDLI